MPGPVVAVAHEPGADPAALLERAIALSGFRGAVEARVVSALEAGRACSAIIVPALDAYTRDSPAATDPRLVEQLIDTLYDLGVANAAVGSTQGGAALWLENRDVFVAADLLGYRYETASGRPYDVIDLAEAVDHHIFPAGGPLAGVGLPRAWWDADLRIVFSANRTDEDDGYALCLSSLLSVLPAVDKDYHYRHRRDVGEVVAALMATAPPDFAFIDAVVSGHGGGGARAPRPLRTDTVIAASDAALADHIGALKMGLDPFVSRLAAPSLRLSPPTVDTAIVGPLEPYADWINVAPALIASTAARRGAMAADRSVRPVLQEVDRELFPFRDPANDWLNRALAQVVAAGDASPDGAALLSLANLWLGEAGKASEAWQVMFDKDALRQREAPINIDRDAISEADYEALPALLTPQAELLRGIAADAGGVRWRFDDGAVVFDGARRIALPYEDFAGAVEINRTIQFMNDYIGGQALVVARDEAGRVTRQIERNLYLPQPNYTAVGGGVVIDVTKIETVVYAERWRKMYWRTVRSENDSAICDDGIVSFEALGDDTLVTIWGRQHFRLPPMWARIDRDLSPTLKRSLVSEAYGRFFARTFANLEAVAEGRDARIGKPWSDDPRGEPLPIEKLSGMARDLEAKGGVSGLINSVIKPAAARPEPLRIDADGFRHFQAPPREADDAPAPASVIAGVLRDLRHAARIDAEAAE
jgi:uncharacterized protein (DUF362 family)